jgi:predicted dehydrogenase
MKILIVGLGSIGQRHVRILKKIFKKKVTLYTLNTSKNNIVIKDNFEILKVASVAKYYNIKKINISDIMKNNIKTAFICNPPNMHLKTAFSLAKQNCNLLVEKPLSTSFELSKIKKLIDYTQKNRLITQVGYQLRFHPGVKIIKNIIEKNTYGEIVGGYFHFGEYLGSVKKFEKFSNSIYVKKNKGGGALQTFSHHLDLAFYFFGKLKCKYALLKNTKTFKIDVEDSCKMILTNYKKKHFLFNLNFLDNPQENFIILNFKKGSLKWDYVHHSILIKTYKDSKVKRIKFKNFQRNILFEKQTKQFFLDIQKRNYKNYSLNDGFEVMKLIHDIRKNKK